MKRRALVRFGVVGGVSSVRENAEVGVDNTTANHFGLGKGFTPRIEWVGVDLVEADVLSVVDFGISPVFSAICASVNRCNITEHGFVNVLNDGKFCNDFAAFCPETAPTLAFNLVDNVC